MTRFIRYFIVFLITLQFTDVIAQDGEQYRVSADFSKIRFEDWVKKIEAESAYRFYFDKPAVDSLSLGIAINDLSLEDALEAIFSETDFSFAIDQQRHVYIVQGRELQKVLPQDFFYRGTSTEATINTTFLDYLDDTKNNETVDETLEIGTKSKTI
ncbi:MAG: hypothetical protein RIA63_05385, partial [Cyclobacteriaceae bacterium]